jgi:sulfur carrier protein
MSLATAATILVNDRPHPLTAGATVAGLLRDLAQSERKGMAVAVNGAVVPRAEWAKRVLTADDSVLVIQATQGG